MSEINIPKVEVNGTGIPLIRVDNAGIEFIGARRIGNTNIRPVGVRNIADNRIWLIEPPNSVPITVPVTEIIGTPIVNMPGCVQVHKENAKNPKNRNKMLVDDDPKGNTVLCDAGAPYYNPADYDYRGLTWQTVYNESEEAPEGIDTGEPPTPEIPDAPSVIPTTVPVTTVIGSPVVNMPGCVKVHKENAKNPKNRNKMLVDDDPKGNTVLCDAGAPYYEPADYDYRGLSWQTVYNESDETPEGIDTGDPPTPDIPDAPSPPETPGETAGKVECPPPNARRIGDLNQAGTEKVVGYELTPDGKICETQWEAIGVAERYLPSVPIVSTTATIALVATSSALLAKPLADLLLKVVKPAVKKLIAKVKEKVLKKKPPVLSRRERLLKQREANAAVKAARKLKGE